MKRKLMYLGGSILIASALCAAFVAAFFAKSDSEHEVVYEYSATCCQGLGENRGIGLRRVEGKLRSQLPDSSAVVRQEIEDAKKEYEQLVREEERIRRAVAEWDVVLIPCGVTTNITAKAVNRGM